MRSFEVPAPPTWHIELVRMVIELDREVVVVSSDLHVRRSHGNVDSHIDLDGRGLTLRSLAVDGASRDSGFEAHVAGLRVELGSADTYLISTVVEARVGGANDEGFTARPGMVSTTCEPEGFRRITYFVDRPANRSLFDVTLVGDRAAFPVMLSNGDRVDGGVWPDGREWERFVDPVDKPSYLFAVVAGELQEMDAVHRTVSGREISLTVVASPAAIGGARFALDILDRVMTFDERQSGVEHDLDHLIFAALPGYPDATEYHGLMFFDEQILIADESGHTDDDLLLITANVAHEYGHHLRGNRVTVSSWGQLALKEGLTVLFQNDVRRHLLGDVGRIMDLLDLRRVQYPEEITIGAPVLQGEVADPHQLYTRTTYLKGGEIFRMMRTTMGDAVWRSVIDAFVDRHDLGSASVADFVAVATSVVPQRASDIEGIARWFGFRGRPRIVLERTQVDGSTDFVLRRVDGSADEPSIHFPLDVAALGDEGRGERRLCMMTGREMPLEWARSARAISPIRDFASLVDFESRESTDELRTIMSSETDQFSRWRAGEQLMINIIDRHRAGDSEGAAEALDALTSEIRVLLSSDIDHGVLAQMLMPPDEFMLGDREPVIDVDGVSSGLVFLRERVGAMLHDDLAGLLERTDVDDRLDRTPDAIKRRMLIEPALGYLLSAGSDFGREFALRQFESANNTRALRALVQLAHFDDFAVDDLFAETRRRWAGSPRLIDRWMRAQSGSRRRDTHERVRRMLDSGDYVRSDRSRVMGVWFPYCTRNRSVFHDPSGEGYRLFVDEVAVLMGINAGLVLRLVGDLLQFKRFEPHRRQLMRAELERLTTIEGFPEFAVGILQGLLAES